MCSQTVNINCTFDAGYSFVGYTLDPLALKQARIFYIIYIYIYIYIYITLYIYCLSATPSTPSPSSRRAAYMLHYMLHNICFR